MTSQAKEKPITIGGVNVLPTDPLPGLVHRPDLGLVIAEGLDGSVLHEWTAPNDCAFEVRSVITPAGDYLVAVCAGGGHYAAGRGKKENDLIAYRSSDKGKSWTGGKPLWDVPYSQHGFVPLIPRGTRRIYSVGTEPAPGNYSGIEDAAIGFRYSDDDGHTWSAPEFIRPINDPHYMGMSVIHMTETDRGAWLIGSHTCTRFLTGESAAVPPGQFTWPYAKVTGPGPDDYVVGGRTRGPIRTVCRQYILRTEDRGKTWELLPGKRPHGWFAPGFDRMDEIRPINLGNDEIFALARTPEGHLWETRSLDDGKSWSPPRPSPLIHPDAPAMLFKLADGKTLVAFHHNRHGGGDFNQSDRSELWASLSADGGRSWGEPRFVLAIDGRPFILWNSPVTCTSYVDLLVDGENLHLFVPHNFHKVVHLRFTDGQLRNLPTRAQLAHHPRKN